jgi:DNA-binding MarR family transcriptional regulator
LAAPSYSFLIYLFHNEGLTQRDLCQILAVNDALASRTMRTLENQNYIVRKRSVADTRAYELYLTEKSRKIIPILTQGYEEWWDKVLEQILPEEQEILADQLEQMTKSCIPY